MIETVILIYILGSLFMLGFGVAEEAPHTNPNWSLVILLSIVWPVLIGYGVWCRLWNTL